MDLDQVKNLTACSATQRSSVAREAWQQRGLDDLRACLTQFLRVSAAAFVTSISHSRCARGKQGCKGRGDSKARNGRERGERSRANPCIARGIRRKSSQKRQTKHTLLGKSYPHRRFYQTSTAQHRHTQHIMRNEFECLAWMAWSI